MFCSSSRTRRTSATSTLSWASSSRCSPQAISPGFCFFFLRLVALCVSLWVGGVPLAVFSPSPALVVFLSSGLVCSPCGVFPVVSPCFSGGRGGRFFLCYLLHLAFFSSRFRVGQDGLPTRKTPGPPRPFPWCVRPDPSPAGRAEVKGGGGDGGVCDPAQLPRHYDDGCPCFCSRGAPRPSESTLAVSPELESILGVWLFFVCNTVT